MTLHDSIGRRKEKQDVNSVSTLLSVLTRPAVEGGYTLSTAPAWCTGHKMPRDSSLKRDHGSFANDCDFPEVRRSAAGPSDQNSLGLSVHFRNADREEFAVEFGRFLERTDGVAKTNQLFEFLSAFALKLGCMWIAYGPLPTDRKALKPVRCEPEEILHYPDEWQERCLENGYARIAPIVTQSRMAAGPLRWSDVYSAASTTEYERRIFDEAATFGLRSGITVPLRGPEGSFAIMNFARHCDREFQNRTITYLQLAATLFHLRVANVANSNVVRTIPTLSPREKECILWVARGKSSWDIGTILKISENTVNFHIKNVMGKFGAASRTVAAIKAISLGIIEF
ncbi:helix-turn-helix transcriptional regulator [Ensifer aridi]|uniref:helix-turn-helix transcriptional regulator n=1 Tax=Ensifer aridi TaxID=1708715 RepID=UPI000A11002C|nr:LuxR family transcriptional regulator [Ensifer aridi]